MQQSIEKLLQEVNESLSLLNDRSFWKRINEYKKFWTTQREELYRLHQGSMPSEDTAQALSKTIDLLIQHLFKNFLKLYREKHGKWTHPIVLIGLSSYGREEISPNSKLNIKLLYPKKTQADKLNNFLMEFKNEVIAALEELNIQINISYSSIKSTLESSANNYFNQSVLLDARPICGTKKLYDLFKNSFTTQFKKQDKTVFIKQCFKSQMDRHKKTNNVITLLEPDINAGIGGLRDYNVIRYICQMKWNLENLAGLIDRNILSSIEVKNLLQAHEFLLQVRHELHFLSDESQNVLDREKQPQIAWNLGYKNPESFLRIELLMKDYYTHTKVIRLINQKIQEQIILNNEGLVAGFIKKIINQCLEKPEKHIDGFILSNNTFIYEDEHVFQEDPGRLIRIFRHCQQFRATLHPKLKALIRESLNLITPEYIEDLSVAKSFCSILQCVGEVYPILTQMHELGILGRYVPEFNAITNLVQHGYCHKFTADIHTLKAIQVLDKIFESKDPALRHYSGTIRSATRPFLLYLILFLHDIGKAESSRNHALYSAKISEPILKRLGINSKQQELILFVIKNHPQMARFWRKFDVNDPEVINSFAKFLHDADLLKYLYVETYCDYTAVAPNFWNSYKELLHTSFFENTLAAFNQIKNYDEDDKVRKKMIFCKMLSNAHPEFTEKRVKEILSLYPERYFDLNNRGDMKLHNEMIELLHIQDDKDSSLLTPIIDWKEDLNLSATIVTIVAWDRPGLLPSIAGALAASGLNILSVKAFVCSDKIVIYTFCVIEADDVFLEQEQLKTKFLGNLWDIIVEGADPIPLMLAQTKKFANINLLSHLIHTPPIPTTPLCINVYHELSLNRTIVEVKFSDQIGLLYRLSNTIIKQGFNITFARLTTENGCTLNTFHIQKTNSEELTSTSDLIALRENLNEVLSSQQLSEAIG